MKKLDPSIEELNLSVIPPLIGEESKRRFEKIYSLLKNTRFALFFTGPAGTGKTVFALNLAKRYAEEHEVPAYYMHGSPELTKTTTILGHRLVAGTLKVVEGCIARAMNEGAIVIFDEASHSGEELLLTLNQLIERTAMVSAGELTVYAKPAFRMIFCANPSTTHTGNTPLPTAFATRPIFIRFDYPSFREEVEIAAQILTDKEINSLPVIVPYPVAKYVVSLMRDHRSEVFPLSARNAAACLSQLNVVAHHSGLNSLEEAYRRRHGNQKLESAFRRELGYSEQQNLEANLTMIYKRIHDEEPASTVTLAEDSEVREFIKFIAALGVEEFKEAVESCFMVYADLDSVLADVDKVKERIKASIL